MVKLLWQQMNRKCMYLSVSYSAHGFYHEIYCSFVTSAMMAVLNLAHYWSAKQKATAGHHQQKY